MLHNLTGPDPYAVNELGQVRRCAFASLSVRECLCVYIVCVCVCPARSRVWTVSVYSASLCVCVVCVVCACEISRYTTRRRAAEPRLPTRGLPLSWAAMLTLQVYICIHTLCKCMTYVCLCLCLCVCLCPCLAVSLSLFSLFLSVEACRCHSLCLFMGMCM